MLSVSGFEVILRTGVDRLFGGVSVLKFYYLIRSFEDSETNKSTFTGMTNDKCEYM